MLLSTPAGADVVLDRLPWQCHLGCGPSEVLPVSKFLLGSLLSVFDPNLDPQFGCVENPASLKLRGVIMPVSRRFMCKNVCIPQLSCFPQPPSLSLGAGWG